MRLAGVEGHLRMSICGAIYRVVKQLSVKDTCQKCQVFGFFFKYTGKISEFY